MLSHFLQILLSKNPWDKTSSPCQEAQKSTLNIDNPDEELYQNQIDILKAVNAQREAENKRLGESNDLKAKRIMNLELNWRKPDNCLIVVTTWRI